MAMRPVIPLRVLVADVDLYSRFEEEPATFRKLFAAGPDARFTYVLSQEPVTFPRPSHIAAIHCGRECGTQTTATDPESCWAQAFANAERIAAAIGPREFDILEIPDYRADLLLLPWAMQQLGAQINKIVVSLHRRVSRSIQLGWDRSARAQQYGHQFDEWERLLFAAADVRYGFSRENLEDWSRDCSLGRNSLNSERTAAGSHRYEGGSLESRYLSPLTLIERPKLFPAAAGSGPPAVSFLGRLDRHRGADRFLDFVWQLPRSSYSGIDVVGETVHGEFKREAIDFLREIAESRELDVRFQASGSLIPSDKSSVGRSVLISPAWYDPGHWSILEALLSGCPAVIGPGAVRRLLDDELPTLPYVRFEPEDSPGNARRTVELLTNYDRARDVLRDGINAMAPPLREPTLPTIYAREPQFDYAARNRVALKYDEQSALSRRSRPGIVGRAFRACVGEVSLQTVGRKLREHNLTWMVALAHWRRTRKLANLPESTAEDRRHKIHKLEEATGGERFGRAWIWASLSRLEFANGRDLVGAAYALRTMRLTGRDILGQLTQVATTLRQNGFEREAIVADLMYGPATTVQRHTRQLAWLDDCLKRHAANPSIEFERVDDRRGSANPRAAIIVSLYNAASKTPRFLDALLDQTLLQRGQVELILVDSGSPADEYNAIVGHRCFTSSPSVYLRTAARETIQQAWNRGLTVARAPYVTMLGVDESILPDCLELLGGELDRRPDLDWIQSNCVTYDTDAHGNYLREEMFSDRRGYHPELVRLDTNYLSWVGALYRRNLHERLGYYDPSYRGSGDKEFKNRLLPYIKTDCYPRTLGVFWNYPDIRASQYPLAEIEDLRAWQLFRTSAGVEYSHRNNSPREIVQGATHALKYRRSFRRELSTDLEYGYRLLDYANRRDPESFPAADLRRLSKTLDNFRTLDYPTWKNEVTGVFATANIMSRLKRQNRRLNQLFPNAPELTYFTDERCEYINWCWSFLS